MICSTDPLEATAPTNLTSTPNQTEATPEQIQLLELFFEESKRAFSDSRIWEKMEKSLGMMERPDAWEAFRQMTIFLWLSQITPKGYRFSPTKKIDAVWHEFILFTEQYAKFCQNTVGHFIHHRPYTSLNREEVKSLPLWLPDAKQVKRFVKKGPIPFVKEYWDTDAECSSDCKPGGALKKQSDVDDRDCDITSLGGG